MSRRVFVALCGLTGLLLASSGCSLQKVAADQMTPMLQEMSVSFRAEKSVRHAREAAPAMLSFLDGFLSASPENTDLLLLSSEMHGSFAFAFVETEDEDWARVLYRKGLSRAFAAANLEVDRDFFEAAKEGGERLDALLADADEDDVPYLFWVGFNWGAWINLSRDEPSALADLPRVEAIMRRVQALDPAYYHGGADLFFGFYYGGRTKLLGGDPEKSKEAFERVFATTEGKFLLAKVIYAKTYCVNSNLPDEFERVLEEVIEADPDAMPEESLANAMAQKRAEELLYEAEDLFPEELPPPPPDEGG